MQMRKTFIRMNAILLLVSFAASVVLIDGARVPVYAADGLEGSVRAAMERTENWVVANGKGVFETPGAAAFETWADGKEYMVVRDPKGALLSWGEAKVQPMADGSAKFVVTDNAGQPMAAKDVNPSLLQRFKNFATSTIPGGGRDSANFQKGYEFGSEAPGKAVGAVKGGVGKLVDGVKGLFHHGAASPSPAAPASAPAPSAPGNEGSVAASANAPAASGAQNPLSLKPVVENAKNLVTETPANFKAGYELGQQGPKAVLGAAVEGVKGIPGQVKGAAQETVANFKAGQAAGAAAGDKLVNGVKNLFHKADAPAAPAASQGPATPAPAAGQGSVAASQAPAPAASGSAAPAASQAPAPAQASGAQNPLSLKPVVENAKNLVTETPANFKAGYELGQQGPKAVLGAAVEGVKGIPGQVKGAAQETAANFKAGQAAGAAAGDKLVNGVKNLFHKADAPAAPAASQGPATPAPAASGSAAPAASQTPAPAQASGAAAPASAGSSASAAPAAEAPAAAPAAESGKPSFWKKVTTPIEGGGKDSAAFKKGYDFGNETPRKVVGAVKDGVGNVVDGVKGLFGKEPVKGHPAEAAAAKEIAVDPETGRVEAKAVTAESKAAAESKGAPEAKGAVDKPSGKVAASLDDAEAVKAEAAVAPQQPGRLSTALNAGGQALKASFSVKNLALSAGVTVGFKLIEQVRSGEGIDIGKAVGHLATGQFVGGFVGSSLGSAAGTVVGTLLGGAIPVVGPILSALTPAIFAGVGGHIGSQLGDGLATGKGIDLKAAFASMDKGQIVAQAIGGTVGCVIGNMLLPGIGGTIGGIVGGMIGSKILGLIRGTQGKSKVVSVNVGGRTVVTTAGATAAAPAAPVVTTPAFGVNNAASMNARERMIAAYKRYSEYLSNGRGNLPEAAQALQEYKAAQEAYQSQLNK